MTLHHVSVKGQTPAGPPGPLTPTSAIREGALVLTAVLSSTTPRTAPRSCCGRSRSPWICSWTPGVLRQMGTVGWLLIRKPDAGRTPVQVISRTEPSVLQHRLLGRRGHHDDSGGPCG